MASNSFGNLFRITTWGESHGRAIGVVIDGCPAGLPLAEKDIQTALFARAPGKTPFTSPRKEPDCAEILSGVFEGVTTGTPISILIPNKDADSSKYEPIRHLHRPGHANFTYLKKYGVFDFRGGGRSSARETAARVAAGAVAQKVLDQKNIKVLSALSSVGEVSLDTPLKENDEENITTSPIFCPDEKIERAMMDLINLTKEQGDSLGGSVSFAAFNLPVGVGEPIYQKLEAQLALALMSLPASKGFELGEGFASTRMLGSAHNDPFSQETILKSNHAGGTLGGIATGMPLLGRVAFKPTSSILKTQETTSLDGKPATFTLPEGSRHDPCVAIRAVPVVKAMCQLVLADLLLLNKTSRLDG
jgi:chorismate synthase